MSGKIYYLVLFRTSYGGLEGTESAPGSIIGCDIAKSLKMVLIASHLALRLKELSFYWSSQFQYNVTERSFMTGT